MEELPKISKVFLFCTGPTIHLDDIVLYKQRKKDIFLQRHTAVILLIPCLDEATVPIVLYLSQDRQHVQYKQGPEMALHTLIHR